LKRRQILRVPFLIAKGHEEKPYGLLFFAALE
jgi:hypothetical protein